MLHPSTNNWKEFRGFKKKCYQIISTDSYVTVTFVANTATVCPPKGYKFVKVQLSQVKR